MGPPIFIRGPIYTNGHSGAVTITTTSEGSNGDPYHNSTWLYRGWGNTPLPKSKAEKIYRELLELKARLSPKKRAKLEQRLRAMEQSKKAQGDRKSRQRQAPRKGMAPAGSRLTTYDDALAARMASRRLG